MSSIKPPDFEQLLAMAHRLANGAAEAILPHFRTECATDHKGGSDFDPVTQADIAAEQTMRALIETAYPKHGIIGEELGRTNAEAEYCWVLDPIDGTRAFIMGQPLWGCMIGLTRRGDPLLGLVDQPFTGERFWSGAEESLFRHRDQTQTMRTRDCGSLADAYLAASTPDLFTGKDEIEAFERLRRRVRLRRFGGDCYNYCLLALGQIDLVVESGLKDFDILPLMPIITQAGGVVTDWQGGDCKQGGRILAAANPRLHEAAMKVLAT